MTDFIGMKQALWKAIWEASEKAIDEVLEAAWRDGYMHGVDENLYKEQEKAEK